MTAPDTTEVKMLEILVAWRDHVEKLKKWNGKLPTDEAVRQLKGLLVDAQIKEQMDWVLPIVEKAHTVEQSENISGIQWFDNERLARLNALQQTRQERSE